MTIWFIESKFMSIGDGSASTMNQLAISFFIWNFEAAKEFSATILIMLGLKWCSLWRQWVFFTLGGEREWVEGKESLVLAPLAVFWIIRGAHKKNIWRKRNSYSLKNKILTFLHILFPGLDDQSLNHLWILSSRSSQIGCVVALGFLFVFRCHLLSIHSLLFIRVAPPWCLYYYSCLLIRRKGITINYYCTKKHQGRGEYHL